MSARRPVQPARLLWLALAPALVAVLASPGAARGGCGEHARPTAPGFDIRLASLDLSDQPIPVPPRPCNGPSCSGRRPEAPIATPPASRTSPERGLALLRIDPPDVAGVRSDFTRRQPAYESPALDRPDRPPRP